VQRYRIAPEGIVLSSYAALVLGDDRDLLTGWYSE